MKRCQLEARILVLEEQNRQLSKQLTQAERTKERLEKKLEGYSV